MLPTSEGQSDGAQRPEKYCDSAVGALLDALELAGARRERCVASMAGGATMFAMPSRVKGPATIGERNLTSTRDSLRVLNLTLAAQDCGGERGRSMEMDCSDGSVRVWSAAQAPRRL